MDTGSIRQVGSAAATAYVRPEPIPVRQAVPTQLAPSQSVTATADASPTRNDAPHLAPAPTTAHNVFIDPATREVVYRVVNVPSGQVISQVPDPVELQLAAYTKAVQRAVDKGKTPTEAQVEAELNLQV
jgi:hypothetical protein